MKPSEIIEAFIDLCDQSRVECAEAEKVVREYDEKTLDWVHKIEKENNANARSKICTAWHEERVKRRKEKDRIVMYEKICTFSKDAINSGTLKRLRRLLEEQKASEEFLASDEKVYKGKKVIE